MAGRTVLSNPDFDEVERQLIEHAHELSLSADPVVAVRGRYMKDLSPAFLRWMSAEIQRDPFKAEYLCDGFAQAMANEVGTLSGNLAQMNQRLSVALVAEVGHMFAQYLLQVRQGFRSGPMTAPTLARGNRTA